MCEGIGSLLHVGVGVCMGSVLRVGVGVWLWMCEGIESVLLVGVGVFVVVVVCGYGECVACRCGCVWLRMCEGGE